MNHDTVRPDLDLRKPMGRSNAGWLASDAADGTGWTMRPHRVLESCGLMLSVLSTTIINV
jgi:hypothetical protein